jgi:hypothetical protein
MEGRRWQINYALTAIQIVRGMSNNFRGRDLATLRSIGITQLLADGCCTSIANIVQKRKSKSTFARCVEGN